MIIVDNKNNIIIYEFTDDNKEKDCDILKLCDKIRYILFEAKKSHPI